MRASEGVSPANLLQAAHDAGTVSGYRQALDQLAANLEQQAAGWRAELEAKRARLGWFRRWHEVRATAQAAAALETFAKFVRSQRETRAGEEQQRRDIASQLAGRLDAELAAARAPRPGLLDRLLG